MTAESRPLPTVLHTDVPRAHVPRTRDHCAQALMRTIDVVVVAGARFLGTDSEEDVLHGVHREAEAEDPQPLLRRVESLKELGEATLRQLWKCGTSLHSFIF